MPFHLQCTPLNRIACIDCRRDHCAKSPSCGRWVFPPFESPCRPPPPSPRRPCQLISWQVTRMLSLNSLQKHSSRISKFSFPSWPVCPQQQRARLSQTLWATAIDIYSLSPTSPSQALYHTLPATAASPTPSLACQGSIQRSENYGRPSTACGRSPGTTLETSKHLPADKSEHPTP